MSLDQVVTSVSNQQSNKPCILVVDDSRVVRVSLKNILQQTYEVIEAEDGEKAWEIIHENPSIRLVFSDLAMPKLDGRELLKKFRLSDNEKIRDLPFIVITGREENQEIRSQLTDEGANDLVTKPFDSDDIIELAKIHTSKQPEQGTILDEVFLNGISDKVVFSQNARKQLSFAIRNKNELALLLLQFDQFEKIKKHYSDPAIEHILITAAEVIRTYTRIEDTVAYFGEGTFAILFPAANSVSTKYLGRKILSDILSKKFYLGEADTTVTASIGVSAPEIKPGITFSDLLNLAEQRLQAAIKAGGNRVVDKGNAIITPVSTLLYDSPETPSANQEIFRQTEISMRKLAEQEIRNKQTNNGLTESRTIDTRNLDKINNDLLSAEYENSLLKEEVFRLHKQTEELEKLKKQLYETNALQQQTQFKYQQLKSDYELMRKRAETAESNQSLLMETENDRSIIEQHLLQESEIIQNQLNKANEQISKSEQAFKASEVELSNLKDQLIKQKEDFEIELADEHMMRSIAEKKAAELEQKLIDAKKENNPFSLTATPSITQIEKKSLDVIKPTPTQPIPQITPNKVVVQQKKQTTPNKLSVKAKTSWPFRMLFVTISILIGLVSFKVWDGLSSHNIGKREGILELNITTKPLIKDALKRPSVDNQSAESSKRNVAPIINNKQTEKNSPAYIDHMESRHLEEAKLQAELTLKELAEEEFLLLSDER